MHECAGVDPRYTGVLPLRVNRKRITAVDLRAALPRVPQPVIVSVLTSLADCDIRFANWLELAAFFKACGLQTAVASELQNNFIYT